MRNRLFIFGNVFLFPGENEKRKQRHGKHRNKAGKVYVLPAKGGIICDKAAEPGADSRAKAVEKMEQIHHQGRIFCKGSYADAMYELANIENF
jgi:hypothetical protein